MVNKKGWLRIAEASIAALIVLGVLLLISGNKKIEQKTDISETLPIILEEISKNVTLREAIIKYDTNKASAETDPDNIAILNEVNKTLFIRIKKDFSYAVRICRPNDLCPLNNYPNAEEVYISERIISSTLLKFDPKKIKLFIWKA